MNVTEAITHKTKTCRKAVGSYFHGLRRIQRKLMNIHIPVGELKPAVAGLAKIIDSTSALHFRNEGRQMVVMPIRREHQTHAETSTPPTEQKTKMTIITTNGTESSHINGTNPVPTNGNNLNNGPVSTNSKPAIEAAIDNLDSFKNNLRDALIRISEITTLLRQAIRDQRTNEREIQSSTGERAGDPIRTPALAISR